MKILFFGSDNFAVPALEALIKNKHKVLCVVTQPDKKKGRHLRLGYTDIKAKALEANLKVFQPENVNTTKSVGYLKKLNADIFVIVSYGQILSQEVLDIPKVFPLNIHASLLPKYRGAAPINWAIINGEKVTGVTIMQVTKKMDSGPIILQQKIDILGTDDSASLEFKLRDLGADLLLKALPLIKSEIYKLIEQDERKVVFAPKLKKSDGLINWERTAQEITNLIRGVQPWPGAFTCYNGKLLKIYKAKPLDCKLPQADSCPFGGIVAAAKEGITVKTGKGFLLIQELQLEGKKRLTAEEFLLGHEIGRAFTN
ncbi:MAG: methionyl-tRNA formyltransferase [Candidatus Omnitrophota bacterium]